MTEGMTITQYALSRSCCGMRDGIPIASFITRAELLRRSASFESERASRPGTFTSSERPPDKLNMIAKKPRFISSSIRARVRWCGTDLQCPRGSSLFTRRVIKVLSHSLPVSWAFPAFSEDVADTCSGVTDSRVLNLMTFHGRSRRLESPVQPLAIFCQKIYVNL